MFLALDIGNTNIKAGLFDRSNLLLSFEMATDESASVAAYRHSLRGRLDDLTPQTAGISSVVPAMTDRIVQAVRDDFMILPTVIGAEHVTQFRIDYKPPGSLGIDRLCVVAAALDKYRLDTGGYLRPLLVIDAGTATTFDLLVDRVYRGGAIMAGPGLVSKALAGGTAQLQTVELTVPRHPIGDNTVDGLRSGIMFGFIDSVTGMIDRISTAEGRRPFVVATGGAGRLLSENIPAVDAYDPDLVLRGIAILAGDG